LVSQDTNAEIAEDAEDADTLETTSHSPEAKARENEQYRIQEGER